MFQINSTKALMFVAGLGAVATFGFTNLPRQQAEANRLNSQTAQQQAQFEIEQAARQQVLAAETAAQVSALRVQTRQAEFRQAEAERLEYARHNQQLAGEVLGLQLALTLVYVGGGVLIIVSGTLLVIAGFKLMRRFAPHPARLNPALYTTEARWQDPHYRRWRKQQARLQEMVDRISAGFGSVPPPENYTVTLNGRQPYAAKSETAPYN